jgi:hypothetical protein
MNAQEPDVVGRLLRDTAIACVVLTLAAAAAWPGRLAIAGGVLAGGVLMGAAAWIIRGAVTGMGAPDAGRSAGSWVLVKFFTRHAILAAAAYGIMVRLRLDPVGMLVGVSSLALAAGAEAVRRLHRFS